MTIVVVLPTQVQRRQPPAHPPARPIRPRLGTLTTFLKLAQQVPLAGLVSRATTLCMISPVLSLCGEGVRGCPAWPPPRRPPAAHLRVPL